MVALPSSPRRVPVLFTAVAITLAACSDGGPTGDTGGLPDSSTVEDEPVDEEARERPSDEAGSDDGTVDVAAGPYSPLSAVVSVRRDAPTLVEVTATSPDGHTVETPRTATAHQEHSIPLVGLRAERTYALEIDLFDTSGEPIGGEAAEFTTGALPGDLLDYEFRADPERSSPGYTIVEVQPEDEVQYLIALDVEGEVVWYYRNTGVVGGVEQTERGTFLSHYWPLGVRELDVLGNVVGNWQFQPTEAAPDVEPDSDRQAEVIDDDLLEQFAASISGNPGDPPALPVRADWVDLTSFHHEAWAMPNGNVLAMSTTVHELTPEQRRTFCPGDPSPFDVISDVIVEFEPSGRVVRTWDVWDAIDIDTVPGYELCGDRGPFASADDRDWTHGNAAVYDPERDAVIVSLRHTNQVVAFRHLDEEGPQAEVLWIFGEAGTVPVDGDLPYYQHAVEVQDDGSILLYDNGNDRPGTEVADPVEPTYSRAVLYDVDDSSDDPADWRVTQRWEHRTTDVDGSVLYARFLGDADRLENGNVLITHGGIELPEELDGYQHAAIIEVVPEGQAGGDIVWDLRIGTPDRPATVYRSERITSFYTGPDWADAG